MTVDANWTINHFSLSNKIGRGQGYVPTLLRSLADSIEALGDVTVQDITFQAEATPGEQDLSMTVYYHSRPRPKGSSLEAPCDYEPLHHAAVEHPAVAWVVIAHWRNDHREDWCVEARDSGGARERDDENFDTLEDAEAYARATFGIDPTAWNEGADPLRSADER